MDDVLAQFDGLPDTPQNRQLFETIYRADGDALDLEDRVYAATTAPPKGPRDPNGAPVRPAETPRRR